MQAAFVVKLNVIGNNLVCILIAGILVSAQAIPFQNSMKRFDMSVFVRCLGWDTLVFYVIFCTGVFKDMANKLWTVVSSNYRIDRPGK